MTIIRPDALDFSLPYSTPPLRIAHDKKRPCVRYPEWLVRERTQFLQASHVQLWPMLHSAGELTAESLQLPLRVTDRALGFADSLVKVGLFLRHEMVRCTKGGGPAGRARPWAVGHARGA